MECWSGGREIAPQRRGARRVRKLIAPIRQEGKETFHLTCPNLAAFEPLREIFWLFLAAMPRSTSAANICFKENRN
jgi:hypothetical protein